MFGKVPAKVPFYHIYNKGDRMIIYCARNIDNDKMYIGKTTRQLEVRRQDHHESANNGSETHFHRALRQHDFEWTILEHVEKNINEREQFWIQKLDTFNNGYNMTHGGDGGLTYKKGDELYKRIKHKLGHVGKSNPGANPEIHSKAIATIQENIIDGNYFVTGESHGNYKGAMRKKHLNYKGRGASATAKAVRINDVEYASCAAAARAYGICGETVSNRCKKPNYIGWEFV